MSKHGRHRALPRHKKKRAYQLPVIAVSATGLVAAGMFVVVRPTQAEVIKPFIDSTAMATISDSSSEVKAVDRNARLIVEEIDIEPSENVTEDPNVAAGTDFVTKEGVNGRARVTYSVISVDGKEVSRTEVSRTVLEEPVSADVTKGTGKPEVISSELSAVAKGVGDPEGNRAYAKVFIAQEYGWGETQYTCLEKLWKRESNWRTLAKNRSSGAYGIPQALPGRKMGKTGSDWKTNPITQIKWGAGYIKGRYGTPCKAWDHSERKNWY